MDWTLKTQRTDIQPNGLRRESVNVFSMQRVASANGRRIVLLMALLALLGCGKSPSHPDLTSETSWEQITVLARGSTVRMAMWDGDPMINAYMRDYVVPSLNDQYGVTLKLIGGQGNTLVNKLMIDRESGRDVGDVDLMWINGETFYQLRAIDALYGPFTERLPNNQFVDWDNPFVSTDFQQPVEGYECPWGNVQFALIYNSDVVSDPPTTIDDLKAWIKQHPGRFTFDNSFTGMSFLKAVLYELAGGPQSLHGKFDEVVYQEAADRLWTWVREVKPYLWRKGETFPEDVAQLHRLFSNREVDFSMSMNDSEVDNKVTQGVLPESSRAYVLETGTIRNSHYLGVAFNAPNKPAALIVANFLISPDAQFRKAHPEIWGDGSVLSVEKLPSEWMKKFQNIPGRIRVPPRHELERNALMEPAPELMIRLHADFRREVIERVR